MHNFTHRYVVRNEPDRLARYADRMDFDGELARGRLLVGSPATVRERLGGLLRQSGANYFLGAFFFGSLSLEQATRSLELFAAEVMPALA
jgi:alkanesulfonate monooxygenase SsuD/methylene tetrahydromethanopterin reductase-like flavin-dependent oxidoreductase (luciferase family)